MRMRSTTSAASRSNQPVREADIPHVHALVIGRIEPAEAGRYATHQRLISGTSVLPPTPAQVVPLMADGLAPATVETAIAAHERLVSIHPFADGNGHTARLLMNLVLQTGGDPAPCEGFMTTASKTAWTTT